MHITGDNAANSIVFGFFVLAHFVAYFANSRCEWRFLNKMPI